MFERLDASALVSTIGDAARAENIACARRLSAIAELYQRRQVPVEDGKGRELWRIDPWEAVAAEVAAAQSSTPAAASALMHTAICLHERLPKVAALFATGALPYRTVALIVNRTLLALDHAVLDAIDTELAEGLTRWGVLSRNKTEQAIDALIERHDPEARRRTETAARSRYVDVTHHRGTAWLSGEMFTTDGTLLDRRLTSLAHTVCHNDPRTVDQRRADALGALAAGHDTLACACGTGDCPAAGTAPPAAVLIHVVAEQATLDADTTNLHGAHSADGGPEIVSNPERFAEILRDAANPKPTPQPAAVVKPNPSPGLVSGGPTVPASILADLAARGAAQLQPLVHPGGAGLPEPHYRPSAKLADFIRCRDLTCRFPNCDRPAEFCDVDHTIPYRVGGPTHASNLKCLCRAHHLLKTFYAGWRDRQLPDGTIIWTSPTGHAYRTRPGGTLLAPTLSLPTATLPPPPDRTPQPGRDAMMPRRRCSRATDRHRRITAERKQNRATLENRRRSQWQTRAPIPAVLPLQPRDDDPPPF